MKASNLFKISYILEILLFTISVVALNYTLSEKKWYWSLLVAITAVILEIILKKKENNPLINRAKYIEYKSQELKQKLKNNGINAHYFMKDAESINERNNKIQEAIKNANELFLIGETAKSYIDIPTKRHWDAVKAKLNDGIYFKLLIMNPFSESKELRNKLNNVEGTIDRKLDLSRIEKLCQNYPDNLEVRFTDEIYCSLFFTDKYMIYDPYHLGKINDRIENNFIALEFDRESANFRLLKSHFENCWNYSISLSEFLKIKNEQEEVNSNI